MLFVLASKKMDYYENVQIGIINVATILPTFSGTVIDCVITESTL